MKQEIHEDHEKIDLLLKEVQELKELIRQQKP
jgi:hypothetical protein